jgi:two-component system response regulator HydG
MLADILVVDDEPDAAELLRDALARRGYSVDAVTKADDALSHVRDNDVDVVVTDHLMDGMTGVELCTKLKAIRPDVPVILVTGFGNMDTAIAAIRAGAYDFVTKPISVDSLTISVARAVDFRRLTSEVRRLRTAIDASRRVESMIGVSPAIERVKELVAQVADSDTTVLITGESGTGKELVARAVHDLGPRRDAPFVAINCAAMPANLLESELFGHVKGAFTDARQSRAGLFIQAGRGTLFLDEIGEMPLEMQAKLLRVLQERKVRPVGGDVEAVIEARLVTATNRDLETEVEEGRFRGDLYYRVNVVQIAVPPLRARQGDVLTLAQHFLVRIAERSGKPVVGIAAPAARKLVEYDWPGNVRELENCVERAVTLTRMSEIGIDDLPDRIREHRSASLVVGDDPTDLVTLAEMERRYVRKVLAAVGGNKTQAARILGLDRRSLYRRLDDGDKAAKN